ncbi:MAG: hypothetical protein GF411_02890 [Candidatus Lokiarchaeota archaeon]|nr:hypothetical protein [Candidatus Lokiarchaeota archaeon]
MKHQKACWYLTHNLALDMYYEEWILHKTDMCGFDNTKNTLVAFIGYSPVVLCENESLKMVKINMIRWRSLLDESDIFTEDNWFAPASLQNNITKRQEHELE